MWAKALWMVLPCGSTTAFFGVIMILAFKSCSLRRAQQDEIAAAVLSPGCLVVARIHGLVLAVANGVNAGRIDSKADQFFAQRQRAPFTKRPVIFFRAALVTIALDSDSVCGAAFQVIGHFRDF